MMTSPDSMSESDLGEAAGLPGPDIDVSDDSDCDREEEEEGEAAPELVPIASVDRAERHPVQQGELKNGQAQARAGPLGLDRSANALVHVTTDGRKNRKGM
jgi:hypothetical protein